MNIHIIFPDSIFKNSIVFIFYKSVLFMDKFAVFLTLELIVHEYIIDINAIRRNCWIFVDTYGKWEINSTWCIHRRQNQLGKTASNFGWKYRIQFQAAFLLDLTNTEWVSIRRDEQYLQDGASHLYPVNPVNPVH